MKKLPATLVPIGKAVASLSSQLSSDRVTIIPVEDRDQVPTSFVDEIDRGIPERVVSWYEGIAGPMPVLRRALRGDERAALERRRRELLIALAAPPDGHHANRCPGEVAAMFAGFPAMGRHDLKVATAMVDGYLSIVGDLPPWAVIEACRMVRSDEAGLNRDFCPSEPAFCAVVKRIIAPYRQQLRKIDALLRAEPPPETACEASLPFQPRSVSVPVTRAERERREAEQTLARYKREAEDSARRGRSRASTSTRALWGPSHA